MADEVVTTTGGADGTPAASGTPAQTPATTTGTQATSTTTTPDTTRTSAATSGFTYKEDRSQWVPRHRISEETGKRAAVDAENAVLKRQLQALTGVTPTDPNAQQASDIKAKMFELLGPGAAKLLQLSPEQIDRLIGTPDQVQQANSFVEQGWNKHARQTTESLFEKVSEHIGGDLSDRAKGRLKSAFVSHMEGEAHKSKQDGRATQTMQRYIDGDETLIDEFAKEWAEDYFVPAQRKVTSTLVATNRRVPNSTGRTQVTSGVQRPAEFKTLDERIDYAAQIAKERGLVFGS